MKIKSDFVTNSSSTSFILSKLKGYKNNPKIKIEIEINLDRYVQERLSSEIEVKEYLLNCGYEEDEFKTNSYCTNLLNEASEGNEILILEVTDQSGDSKERFLCENGLPDKIEGFKVIQGEGGY